MYTASRNTLAATFSGIINLSDNGAAYGGDISFSSLTANSLGYVEANGSLANGHNAFDGELLGDEIFGVFDNASFIGAYGVKMRE